MKEKHSRSKEPTGVLLVNVGTPDGPDVPAVRRYLREFLTDKRVLTIPKFLRWLLVHLIIAPFRGPKSAHAYKSIWTKDGSPLLVHGKALASALEAQLGDGYVVRLAMRYGKPSVQSVLNELLDQHRVERLVVVPLYPQYSSSATGTAIEKVQEILGKRTVIPSVHVVGDFFDHEGFVTAQAEIARENLSEFKADHVLMSYHGLPESHVKATTAGYCLTQPQCCDKIGSHNRFCYRAQAFATSRSIAEKLGLKSDEYSVAFQSRLGRTPWIKPFTDMILSDLYERGVRRLAVTVPSFVADCLETIEEIGFRARDDWRDLGGEDFLLIPCVNSDPRWVKALADLTKQDSN
jgi:protoporphyrin/coproporphyrin ferrochelatase